MFRQLENTLLLTSQSLLTAQVFAYGVLTLEIHLSSSSHTSSSADEGRKTPMALSDSDRMAELEVTET